MSESFSSVSDFRWACRALREGWLEQQPDKELEITLKIVTFVQQRKDSPSSDRAYLRAIGKLKDSPRFILLCKRLEEKD